MYTIYYYFFFCPSYFEEKFGITSQSMTRSFSAAVTTFCLNFYVAAKSLLPFSIFHVSTSNMLYSTWNRQGFFQPINKHVTALLLSVASRSITAGDAARSCALKKLYRQTSLTRVSEKLPKRQGDENLSGTKVRLLVCCPS